MVKEMKVVKENMYADSKTIAMEMKELINECHMAYSTSYNKLQLKIKYLNKDNFVLLQVLTRLVTKAASLINVPGDTYQKILKLLKDIINHLQDPNTLTINQVNAKK